MVVEPAEENQARMAAFLDKKAELNSVLQQAWFGAVAIRGGDQGYVLAMTRLFYLCPGSHAPKVPDGILIDDPVVCASSAMLTREAADAVAVSLGKLEFPRRALPGRLGHPMSSILLPGTGQEGLWGYPSPLGRWQTRFPRLTITRLVSKPLRTSLPNGAYERAEAILQAHKPLPWDGFAELARTFEMDQAIDFRPGRDLPICEVSAELPLALEAFQYDDQTSAYRITMLCGEGLPRQDITLSVLGEVKRTLRLDDPELQVSTAEPRLLRLDLVLPSAHLTSPLKTTLLWREQKILEEECRAKVAELPLVFTETVTPAPPEEPPLDQGRRSVEAEFAYTPLKIKRRLNVALRNSKSAVLALTRIVDAMYLADERPFYSILASASVIELLLRHRLANEPPERLRQYWSTQKGKRQRSPERYDLFHAVSCAEYLGLIRRIRPAALDACREARNQVHVDFNGDNHTSFRTADAKVACHAMFDLLEVLGRFSKPPV